MTVVIPNNYGYISIRGLQMINVGHSFGTELRKRNPETNLLDGEFMHIDFAKNAESMGAKTWNVATPRELRQALMDARQENRTCVIVAEIDKYNTSKRSDVWWECPPAETSNDPTTKELRKGYEGFRDKMQRIYY